MPSKTNSPLPQVFTRRGLTRAPDDLPQAQIVRRDGCEKQLNKELGPCRFTKTSPQLANRQIVPAVMHTCLLPVMEEVLDALQARHD